VVAQQDRLGLRQGRYAMDERHVFFPEVADKYRHVGTQPGECSLVIGTPLAVHVAHHRQRELAAAPTLHRGARAALGGGGRRRERRRWWRSDAHWALLQSWL
jgi:hypothetical protein